MKSTPGVSESLLSRAQLFEILRRFRARVFLQLDDDAAQSFERAVARQFQVEVHFRVALFVVVVFVDEEAFGIVLDIGIIRYLMTTFGTMRKRRRRRRRRRRSRTSFTGKGMAYGTSLLSAKATTSSTAGPPPPGTDNTPPIVLVIVLYCVYSS